MLELKQCETEKNGDEMMMRVYVHGVGKALSGVRESVHGNIQWLDSLGRHT